MTDNELAAFMVLFISSAVTVTTLGLAWLRRRGSGAGPSRLPEVEARLARIEQAVDAIAIEVERISEGQRFTTRLLSDRAESLPMPSARAAEPEVGRAPSMTRRNDAR